MSARHLKLLRMFAASPSDVARERAKLETVVLSLKPTADHLGLALDIVDWRAAVPDAGRPQQIIFDQLKPTSWDIFIGILWHRFGTPTGSKDPQTQKDYFSGTEEEFRMAYRLWKLFRKPRIVMYRCTRAIPHDADFVQLQHVKDFFKEIEDPQGEFGLLTQSFDTLQSFEKLVLDNMQRLLIEYSERSKPLVLPPGRRRHNLPLQLTSFVGREREIRELKKFLASVRLLTLTGLGGIGKTRLAIKVADEVLDQYDDGVWFADLAPLVDGGMVAQTVASTLGVREESRRPITDTLVDYLKDKNLLLVLDNCEHVIGACAQLANSLLSTSPKVQILATSRHVLGMGETVFRVPSLRVPDSQWSRDAQSLDEYEAPRLFVDRARSMNPGFSVKARDAAALAQVCIQLDGMPLAIELAASRTRVLSVEQIQQRLHDRFSLLTGGRRTALPRHQTLRAVIDWSYNLLTEAEQILFRRLCVFSGGWTLEAAETVCTGNALEQTQVLELLSGLVDKSLVLPEDRGGQRYGLIVTLLEYARKLLIQTDEADSVMRRHAEFFLALAEEAEGKLQGLDQKVLLDRLSVEYDNIRSALNWSLGHDSEIGLRLAGALEGFWSQRGYWSEAQKFLVELLKTKDSTSAGIRAKAVHTAGSIALNQGSLPLHVHSSKRL